MNNVRKIVLTIVLGVMMALPVFAGDLPEQNVETYQLDNGLTVILLQDNSNPTVAVNLWYKVGSKNEKAGRTGFAHLFEHMMFNGSEHQPEDYFSPLQKIGADINGNTSEDRTDYYEIVPSNNLELALWLESDRMGHLLPAMDQEKLDIQRDVVKNERRQRLDNQPYAKGYEMTLEMLYPPTHPYHHSVIGSMDDLSAASLEDVKEFFSLYYAPNNTNLAIVGDFDMDEAKTLVAKYFGYIPPSKPIARMQQFVPQLDREYRSVVEDAVSLAQIDIQWHTPAYYQPGDAEFDILARTLTTGKTSRLYKALVYDKQIAQNVRAYQNSMDLSSTFGITVTGKPGVTAEELEAAVDEVMSDVLANGVTQEEVDRARVNIQANFIRSLQSNNGRAVTLNRYAYYIGEPGKLQWDYDRYSNATPESVMEFAKQYLTDKRVVMVIVPEGTLGEDGEIVDKNEQEMDPVVSKMLEPEDKYASIELPESTVDRSQLPAPAEESPFTPPAIQEGKLKNGAKVYVVEDHRLPLIQTNLVIFSGWSADPADKPGTAALTADMLNEGTKKMSALEISDATQSIGANLNTNSRFDASRITLNVLKDKYAEGLDLVAEVLLQPTFPEEELARLKKLYLGNIENEKRRPLTLALKTFQKELMGTDHPYGQPFTGSGTEEGIEALTVEDLQSFYKSYYKPNNAAFVVTGDITLDEATDMLNKAFKKWKKGKVKAPAIPQPTAPEATTIYIVDKPGAPQSAIALGNIGFSSSAEDEIAAEVMNQALGGMFMSRINMNLREDKAYTYGARSFFWTFRATGALVGYSEVKSDATAASVHEFMKEFKDATGERQLTVEEVEYARDNIAKGFPAGFANITAIANGLSALLEDGESLDYWQTYTGKVMNTTADDALAAAKKYVQPENMVIVIVGDRATIEQPLKDLGIGEVKVIE